MLGVVDGVDVTIGAGGQPGQLGALYGGYTIRQYAKNGGSSSFGAVSATGGGAGGTWGVTGTSGNAGATGNPGNAGTPGNATTNGNPGTANPGNPGGAGGTTTASNQTVPDSNYLASYTVTVATGTVTSVSWSAQ